MNERKTVPYQVYVDPDIREKAVAKARDNGCRLSDFMAMAMEQFIDRPLYKSIDMLSKHNRRKRKNK